VSVLVKTGVLVVLGGLVSGCSIGDVAPATEPVQNGSEAALDDLEIPALSDAQLGTLDGERAHLRLLLTDAPIDADNVFVTFCGVQVAARSRAAGHATDAGGSRFDADRGEPAFVADAGASRLAAFAPISVDAGDAGAAPPHDPSLQDGGVDPAHPVDAGAPERDGHWISLSDACHTYDLLALRNGISAELGLQALPAGSYGQIRLLLSEASIVVDGQTSPLSIPSGMQSGIKVGHGFELHAGSLTTLALDFDAARSIHEAPGRGYIMRPVIELLGERQETLGEVARRESKRDAGAAAGRPAPARQGAPQPGREQRPTPGASRRK
jgi:hypothetical protein